jgi:hypothetical protein
MQPAIVHTNLAIPSWSRGKSVLPKLEPRVRKRGFSKLLPAALEDAARGMKYGALRLEAGDHPSEGIRLYVSAGCKRIEPFGIYVERPRSVCY